MTIKFILIIAFFTGIFWYCCFANDIGFELKQTALGNIFLESEPVAFQILSRQNTLDSISWHVTDFWERKILSGKEVYSGDMILTLPLKLKGYFILEVTCIKEGKTVGSKKTTFAILPPNNAHAKVNSPFGMSTHFGQWWPLELIPLIQKAGVREIRDDIHWTLLEKEKGKFEFPDKYTNYMNALKQAGINPLIVLGFENKNYGDGGFPSSPEMHKAYSRYAIELLTRFPEIKKVEVWNEWNIGYPGNLRRKPEVYYEMLKEVYASIKKEHPNVKIIAGATTGLWWGGYEWMQKLLAQPNAFDNMDAISVHPYNYWDYPGTEYIPECITKLNEMMKKAFNGKSKPIWVTEAGWPVNTKIKSLVLSEKLGTPKGKKRLTTEEMQALYVVRNYVQMIACGVEVCYWYDLVNDGVNSTDNEHNFGLLRHSNDLLGKFVPKPGYISYAVMTRMLDGAKFVSMDEKPGELLSFKFLNNGNDLHVAWTLKPSILMIQSENKVTITNVMGNTQIKTPENGIIIMTTAVGEPVYIKGRVKKIEIGAKVKLPSLIKRLSEKEAIIEYSIENQLPFDLPVSFKINEKENQCEASANSIKKGQITLIVPERNAKESQSFSCLISANGVVLAEPLIDLKP